MLAPVSVSLASAGAPAKEPFKVMRWVVARLFIKDPSDCSTLVPVSTWIVTGSLVVSEPLCILLPLRAALPPFCISTSVKIDNASWGGIVIPALISSLGAARASILNVPRGISVSSALVIVLK